MALRDSVLIVQFRNGTLLHMRIVVRILQKPSLAILMVLLQTLLAEGQTRDSDGILRHLAGLPFAMPTIPVPRFPDSTVNIEDFGAVPDGHTMNTGPIADAIEACAKAGGGTVVVGSGTWLTGPIQLESNVNLHLERGALVQFSNRIEDFPLIAGLDGKSGRFIVTPPIHAYKAKNIAITGQGIFDGAGERWRYVKKDKLTPGQWKDLTSSGGVISSDGKEWWPSKEAMDGEKYLKELERAKQVRTASDYAKAREYLRPDMVRLSACDGVLLDGPTFRNSPRFHLHPVQSENIIVRNVLIQTAWYAQNGDGLDLGACRNVLVYNTIVDVGDDALCLKPARIGDHQKPGPACSEIVIADCVVYHGHGGFVIGSESFGGVRNVAVRNCVFVGTDVGIRFKSARDRGGLVEGVSINGIQMRSIGHEAVLFDMSYSGGSPEVEAKKRTDELKAEPVTALTPRFQNITIKNVICNGAQQALRITGLPEMPVKGILFENVSIVAHVGAHCVDAEGITFLGCRLVTQEGPVFELNRSRNVIVQGGSYPTATPMFLRVAGEQSANICLIGVDRIDAAKDIRYVSGAKPEAVILKSKINDQ
jgi:polygalacturonase